MASQIYFANQAGGSETAITVYIFEFIPVEKRILLERSNFTAIFDDLSI
jgi:hypothetical protein